MYSNEYKNYDFFEEMYRKAATLEADDAYWHGTPNHEYGFIYDFDCGFSGPFCRSSKDVQRAMNNAALWIPVHPVADMCDRGIAISDDMNVVDIREEAIRKDKNLVEERYIDFYAEVEEFLRDLDDFESESVIPPFMTR